ncbi:MAG: glycosyl hydrolase 108 family protein [Vicinamibacterales bacterium]
MTDRDLVGFIIDRFEGHAFTNAAHDRGGATRYGVTQALYSAYMRRPMTAADVKALTRPVAIDILHSEFCYKPGLSQVRDPLVRLCAVDFAIHSGPRPAVRSLQYAAFPKPPYDGLWGPQTDAAVNGADGDEIRRWMLSYRLRFLGKVLARYPEQAKWAGWWNRVATLNELDAPLLTLPAAA